MPPHGGNTNLTDIEIERAITYKVNQSGGHWREPVSRTAASPARSGKEIVETQCVRCHGTGVGGAPKIGAGLAIGGDLAARDFRACRSGSPT